MRLQKFNIFDLHYSVTLRPKYCHIPSNSVTHVKVPLRYLVTFFHTICHIPSGSAMFRPLCDRVFKYKHLKVHSFWVAQRNKTTKAEEKANRDTLLLWLCFITLLWSQSVEPVSLLTVTIWQLGPSFDNMCKGPFNYDISALGGWGIVYTLPCRRQGCVG